MNTFCRVIVVSSLLAAILLARDAGAQFTASFQTNTINVASNWLDSAGYQIGSNFVFDALVIGSGGNLSNGFSYIGYEAGANNNGAAIYSNGLWRCTQIAVGVGGSFNSLTISNRGRVFTFDGSLGWLPGATNNRVLVTDVGSIWSNRFSFAVGNGGGANNSLIVSNGGAVYCDSGSVGFVGSNNTAVVIGNGSTWTNGNNFSVGANSPSNNLTISSGGKVFTPYGTVGEATNAINNRVTITDNASQWINALMLWVGNRGAFNAVVISNAASMFSGDAILGSEFSSSNNSVLVTGSKSFWVNTNSVRLGSAGARNSVVISNGASAFSLETFMGFSVSSTSNSLLVTGTGSEWTGTNLFCGNNGGGNSISILNGGMLIDPVAYVGYLSSATKNSVIVAGTGSVWQATDLFYIGYLAGGNSLVISNGGKVVGGYSVLGYAYGGSNNTALITGPGSVWTNSGLSIADEGGVGNTMTISNGGAVISTGGTTLGYDDDASNNTVIVTGNGSVWNTGGLEIGYQGSANTLLVLAGGKVLGDGDLGNYPGVFGNKAVVAGAGSVWSNAYMTVGYSGDANSLVISNGGVVVTGTGYIGSIGGSTNTVFVTDSGSAFYSTNELYIGDIGAANSLIISNGGKVVSAFGDIGEESFSRGCKVVVTGSGSVWSNNYSLWVGAASGGNSLLISNGAAAINDDAFIGDSPGSATNNLASVSGVSSVWTNRGDLYVGSNGGGNLMTINGGAKAFNGHGYVGYNATASNNSVVVSDGGTVWDNKSGLSVGYLSAGNSVVINHGGVVVAPNINLGQFAGGQGSLALPGGSCSVSSNLVLGNFPCTATGTVTVAGGSLSVTNAAHNAVLEIRSGTFTLIFGTVMVDKFVMTNACGHFAHTGGTLIYGSAVLNPNDDTDGDGIPNSFDPYPLDPSNASADSDGDGLTDLQEYFAGTNPTNSASFFGVTGMTTVGNGLRITWMTGIGKTNALERSAGDASGSYSNNFADIFIVTNTVGTTTNYLDAGVATNIPSLYYRVRLVP